MAMAVDGSHVHSGMTLGSSQALENGWSSTAWEQHGDSLSMEGSGRGEYGGGARMEWEVKANEWEWEHLTMVYPRQGEAGQPRLQSSGEWESAGCSAVTLATSVGGVSGVEDFSIGLASGSSTPSGTSVSSGIPGVGGGRGGGGKGELGAAVKSEPDTQTVMGSPATLGSAKDRLFFNLGGGQSRGSEEKSPERDAGGRRGNGSSVVSGGGDSLNIGLKLGRRTYFKDCGAGGQAEPERAKEASPAAAAPAAAPAAKKQRVMSASTQVARCQVEGCKADLSGCKDYHKRHKVCEMHSKAPKAIAGGIEQRFCQQCSRFHVLSEFDEGKRSCRRRLAGHNERRRKPHPETHSVFGLRNSSALYGDTSRLGFDSSLYYFLDSKRPSLFHRHKGSSLDDEINAYSDVKCSNPWSTTRRDDNNLAYQLQAASAERQSFFSTISRPTADRLLMLLQNPKTQMPDPTASTGMNLGGHHFLEGPLGPLGQGLSLSSSAGGVMGSLEQGHLGSCSQALSSVLGMVGSGRALSLLSSQSWASRPLPGAPPPASAGLSKAADSTLEQLVASSNDSSNRGGSRFAHQMQLPSGGPSTASAQQQFDAQFSSVQSGAGLDSVALNCGLTATGNGTHQRQGCGNGNLLGELGGYEEANPMLGLVGGGQDQLDALSSGFGGSQEDRLTIDLMQMPPAGGSHHGPHGSQSNGVHSGTMSVSGGQYSGFGSLRPFESSIFTSQ